MSHPRVLVLTPSHSRQGGVERIIESLVGGLPARGLDVVVGLARGQKFNDPAAFRAAFPTLPTVEVDCGSGTRTGRVLGVQSALRRTQPAAVLIARLFDAYEAVAALKLQGNAVRLAVTVQAYDPIYIADLAVYAPFVDLCVTSGLMVANGIVQFTSLPRERVVSIPGGVRPPLRVVAPDDERPLRLGYVGRLEQEQKRVLDLPEVLAGLDREGVPWTCRVAGAGPAEGALRAALQRGGLEDRVRFEGWCDLDRLYADVYPDLDVLVHFAAFEGITIAPREAMAHGVVPVVSEFVGCRTERQFLHEQNALLFPVGDAAAATAALCRLHRDRPLLLRLSDEARRSQGGANSDAGTLDTWAEALHGMLGQPSRLGDRVPTLAPPPGRLSRHKVPARWAEWLRLCLGRHVSHQDPGSEWPHCHGGGGGSLTEIAAFAMESEAADTLGGVASARTRD